MTDAEKAYAAAVKEIFRVRIAGEDELNFDQKKFHALDRIPPKIVGLKNLILLHLSGTKISDFTLLAKLTSLEFLGLQNSQISDITPLTELTKLRELDLELTEVSDLTPLANLTSLEFLDLDNTKISDLSHLAALIDLESLWLDNMKVSDLRPIRELTKLGEETSDGLHFSNTPFAQANDETRRLAAIVNNQQRTRETLAYLKTLPPWPEPLPWETQAIEKIVASDAEAAPPEQDAGLPLIWGEHGFQFLVDTIGIDPVTRTVLAELRSLLETMRRQAGNQHEDLFNLAEEMRARCEPQDGRFDALQLHMSFQKLERLNAARARRERPLDDETVTTLESILMVAPGATLADPQVQVLIQRQDMNLATPPAPLEAARAEAVLEAVQAPDAPFAPEVQDLAASANAPGAPDRIAATRPVLAWNVVVAVGRRLAKIVTTPSELVASGILIYWVTTNYARLQAMALSMGTDIAVWMGRVLRALGEVTRNLPM